MNKTAVAFALSSASDAAQHGMTVARAIREGWSVETIVLYAKLAHRSYEAALHFVTRF